MEHSNVIKIQSWFRGIRFRLNRLPSVLYYIQKYLSETTITFSTVATDGRINSSIDEDIIIELLSLKFKIILPKIRMWYDILVKDFLYGWIPVNLKSTTTKTNDNAGNLAMCVFAYTNENLDLFQKYDNGHMSKILLAKIKSNDFNHKAKKDYYFIVLNKINKEVIINSVKGLVLLTPNVNNLPFQICWTKNKQFKYKSIGKSINQFLTCIQKPEPSWQEMFMNGIRSLEVKNLISDDDQF
jgi:hypothetical protein